MLADRKQKKLSWADVAAQGRLVECLVFEIEKTSFKPTKGYREGRKGSRNTSKEMNRLEARREANERRNKARSEITIAIEWNSPSRVLLPPSIVSKASSTREEFAQTQRLEFRYKGKCFGDL